MDIRSLQLYLALCDSLHFGKTAETMHVSPSTLSRAIQRLEQQTDQTLLQRDNRQVDLTEAGLAFKNFAQQTVSQWQKLQQDFKTEQDKLTGQLKLFCSVTASYSHLPQILDKFRQQHPLVEIKLITGDPADALEKIKHQQVDIALAAYPEKLPNNLHFLHLDNVPLSIVAPTIACQVTEQLQQKNIDWQTIPFILPEHGPARKRLDKWFKDMNIKPNIYAQVSGHEAIVSMVALGFGISIAPDVVIKNSPVKDRIQSIKTPFNIEAFELGCCTQSKRLTEKLIGAFMQILTDQ